MMYSPQQQREHVRAIQRQLRTLSLVNPDIPTLMPDGYYCAQTAQAVAVFQRHQGLPVSGETDQNTWNALHQAGQAARFELDDAASITPFWDTLRFIGPAAHARICLVQALLATLCCCFGNLAQQDINGRFDDATVANISKIQSLAGLPTTGEVDKKTWKAIAGVYNVFATAPDTPS